MNFIMKRIFLIIFLLSLSFFVSNKVKADVVADYSLDMRLNTDLSSAIDVNVMLQNNSDSSLISAYTIEFPFEITNANAMLEGKPVSIILDIENGISTITIDFLTNVIKPGQKANLTINLFTLNSLKEVFKTKQLYLPYPASNYSYSKINVSITYPVSLGSISYSSEYKYATERVDDNFLKVVFNQTAPVFFIWGNPELNISFESIISNRKDSINHTLFNLIPEYSNQTVDYLQVFQADYALTDKVNNNFAFITIDSNSSQDLYSSSNIKLSSANSDIVSPGKYNWNLDLDSILGQKIYSQISQGTDNTSKLNSLNEFLFSNYSLSTDKVSKESLDVVWGNNINSLNTLQYCYLLVSTAEYLGLEANVEYGYNIFGTSEAINPSIWCSIYADNRTLILDFANQKVQGYPVFSTSSVDRIKMGIWHPSQSYNDILGILSDAHITANVSEANAQSVNIENTPELTTEFPKNVFSGEFYSGIVNINNPSAKILKVNSLNINNESVLESLRVGELDKAIMPLQKNSLKIDYLRETDFVLNLSREIKIEAELNKVIVSNSTEVRFEPDFKLLALFVVILLVTLSVFIYLVYKLLRRKL